LWLAGDPLIVFRRLAKADNRGVLIVTHDPKVRPIADRVVTIRDGKLSAPGHAS
jgi:ABC-type lipoprotein export system ATPase subunit